MKKAINLNTVANGALLEKANLAVKQIFQNIYDPNTEPTKARKLTMTVTFKPNESRDLATALIDVKTALAPAKGANTNFIIGEDAEGVTGAEMKSGIPGQMFIDADGDLADDKGNKLSETKSQEEETKKVVEFK